MINYFGLRICMCVSVSQKKGRKQGEEGGKEGAAKLYRHFFAIGCVLNTK